MPDPEFTHEATLALAHFTVRVTIETDDLQWAYPATSFGSLAVPAVRRALRAAERDYIAAEHTHQRLQEEVPTPR